MNHQDLTVDDIVKDDSLTLLSEQDRNVKLAQILKKYLDSIASDSRNQNNLSNDGQSKQDLSSGNLENDSQKIPIKKDADGNPAENPFIQATS